MASQENQPPQHAKQLCLNSVLKAMHFLLMRRELQLLSWFQTPGMACTAIETHS
jgi:hypothetical protein